MGLPEMVEGHACPLNTEYKPMSNSINAQSLLGQMLLAFGYAKESAIEEAFAWQKAERDAAREPGFIGAILVERKVVNAEQRDFALQVQTHLRQTFEQTQVSIDLNADSKIGEILVALGFTDEQSVNSAFAWQKAERDAGRDPGFIGEILVSRNVVSLEQRDFGMKVQNALRGV